MLTRAKNPCYEHDEQVAASADLYVIMLVGLSVGWYVSLLASICLHDNRMTGCPMDDQLSVGWYVSLLVSI